jgi:hypothetical protein
LERTVASPPPRGGTVWAAPDAPIDFSVTFRPLEALISRGLTPFLALTFFPPAVSLSATTPPATFERWQTLVRTFLEQLAADSCFGPAALRTWWFEIWNEPNIAGFWSGSQEEYFALYRATAQAVVESGLEIRLGGPVIAYLPGEDPNAGRVWMEAFLRFLSAEPDLKCDFLSLHRKGTFGPDEPNLRLLVQAVEETAAACRAIDPVRFTGLPIVDDEADEKVGFDTPYEPRMTERQAAWQTAVLIAHDALSATGDGRRVHAAADNANLQLVRAPFDGRRSLVTRASSSMRDLFKLPVYAAYELLRLLGEEHGAIVAGGEHLYPTTDLFHLISVSPGHLAALWTNYPTPDGDPPAIWEIDFGLTDVPWQRVNVAHFRIDATHSNAYTAAGRTTDRPFPTPEEAGAIRLAQELTTLTPIRRDLSLPEGTYRATLTIEPYATSLLWITPFDDQPVATPTWLETTVEDGNVILRWTPNREPHFYGCEVVLLGEDGSEERLSPEPLRAAMWVDTAPPPGRRIYGVRAVSASGVASATAVSDPVEV